MVSPVSYKTSFSSSDLGLNKGYSYGFNGMEKDDEHTQEKYDFGARMYNSKLGKMFSTDPKEASYPWQSTYAYYANSPISTIDFNGEGEYESFTFIGVTYPVAV